MTRLLLLFTLIIFAIYFNSCNLINPKEPTPYFLNIDSVQLHGTNYATEGATTQKIKDVWVYYNNNLLGAFELPAKVPIIGDASGSIDIRAGILRNGLEGDRTQYPFYAYKNIPINFPLGKAVNITPVFEYVPFAQMNMMVNEDFEIGNSFIPLSTDTPMQKVASTTYGNYCGLMSLDSAHPQSVNVIATPYPLLFSTIYFLEMDYKCDVQMEVSLICTTSSGTTSVEVVGGVNPKDKWNKVYFDIGQVVSKERAKYYSIVISAFKPSDQKTGYALVDNIKLIGPK